jgi:multiple antibiotic resistance protein
MLDFAITALASILFVVDPPGALPAYLSMTADDDPVRRRQTVWRATLVATITMLVFAAMGGLILRVFGFTMAAFRIAGGLILLLVALDMLRAQRSTQEGPNELSEGAAKDDVAVTPLGVPMLAGPAALSTVATLMGTAQTWLDTASVYLAILITGAAIYLTLRLAEPIYRALGRSGINVFSRVLGLIVAAIAVQFILDGLKAAELFPLVPGAGR